MLDRRLLINAGALCVVACAWLLMQKKRCRGKRVGDTKSKLYHSRKTRYACTMLVPRTRRKPRMHFPDFRMSAARIEELLGIIGPEMQRQGLNSPLSSEESLCITLRYLASGTSMSTLSLEHKVPKDALSRVVEEVCRVLWDELFPRFMATPNQKKWSEIADDMFKLWDVPNCVGAIGGRHVKISSSANAGQAIDMVLMATCDSYKCFTLVDLECHRRITDEAVFSASIIGHKLRNSIMDLPDGVPLPGTSNVFPPYFAADVFPLMTNIIQPYPYRRTLAQEKRVFNYRLGRAHSLIDNVMGILVARWRIYRAPINADISTVEAIVKGTCILHNFLMMKEMAMPGSARSYCPPALADREVGTVFVKGDWHDMVDQKCALQPIGRIGSNNFTKEAEYQRSCLMGYFDSNGAIPGQDTCIDRYGPVDAVTERV